MTIIAYPLHFGLLAVAVLVLIGLLPLSLPLWPDRISFLSMLYGLLHGCAVVLALNHKGMWLRRVTFVVLAGGLSIAVPYAALFATPVLGLRDDAALVAAFAVGSALG
ncbi:MAG: hypothetical protein WBO00_03255, partial [Steroidobacteraceae bacterium]